MFIKYLLNRQGSQGGYCPCVSKAARIAGCCAEVVCCYDSLRLVAMAAFKQLRILLKPPKCWD